MVKPRATENPPPPARSLRAEQAEVTRRRILDAAHELFVSSGYTATTIEAIARQAAVSVQTVYNAVGNKRAALAGVYDRTLAGDDEPVPIVDRPTFKAMLAETTARGCLTRYAELGRELAERALPIVAVIVSEAANPDVRALAETIEEQRATGTRAVARHVADRFGLRAGLDIDTAADVLWVLTAPETMIRFVQRRGWTWDAYEQWLADAMTSSLTAP